MFLFLLVLAVHVEVHTNLGEHVREQTELLILVLVPQQLLVETVKNSIVEFGVVHAADHCRVVSFRYQCAGGENHPVVEVLDAELEMQTVVDTGSQFVDALLVDVVDVEQGRVVGDVVELLASFLLVFLTVLEHPGGFPVVEDAHDVLVFRIHDADVLQKLLRLRRTQCDLGCLRLQNNSGIGLVGREIPAIRLVEFPLKSQLVECRQLTHAGGHPPPVVVQTQYFARLIPDFILGHVLCHFLPLNWFLCSFANICIWWFD